MRGQACDALPSLQKGVNRAERFFDNFLHAHEAAADALFGKLHNSGLRIVEDFLRRIALLSRAAYGGISGMNQPPQKRLVTNNFNVVLNAGTVGNAIH